MESASPYPIGVTKSFSHRHPRYAFAMAGCFAFWCLSIRLIVITLTTFFLSFQQVVTPRLEELSEVMETHRISVVGISGLLFVGLYRLLFPLTDVKPGEIFPLHRIKEYLLGIVSGLLLGAAVLMPFLHFKYYKEFGPYINFEELFVTLSNLGTRTAAILIMVYCEEYIFRRKILRTIHERWGFAAAILSTSVMYVLIKDLQFGFYLGQMQLLTLFLVSCCLSLSYYRGNSFVLGAAVWGGILVTLHVLAGQPIFGSEFTGAWLIKYQGTEVISSFGAVATPRFHFLVTGGLAGPLSSFAFQSIVVAFGFYQVMGIWFENKGINHSSKQLIG